MSLFSLTLSRLRPGTVPPTLRGAEVLGKHLSREGGQGGRGHPAGQLPPRPCALGAAFLHPRPGGAGRFPAAGPLGAEKDPGHAGVGLGPSG